MTIIIVLIIVLPLAALQFGLLVVALRDLMNPQRQVKGNKMGWLMVVLFVHVIGPSAYLLFGRGKKTIAVEKEAAEGEISQDGFSVLQSPEETDVNPLP